MPICCYITTQQTEYLESPVSTMRFYHVKQKISALHLGSEGAVTLLILKELELNNS